MSDDLGNNWTKISWSSALLTQPVLDVLPVSDSVVFAATFGSYQPGYGGVYRGVQSGGSWTWTRVLPQHRVTAVARSPFNPNLMFAMSGQL